MSRGVRDPWIARVYRRALVVLPRAFREARGEAMVAMLADEWRERRGLGRAVVAVRAGLGLFRTAVAERVRPSGRPSSGPPVTSLDLKLGVRMLVKHPGLTLVGGFGIAVAVAIGSVAFEGISAVLDPALPVPGGERVVALKNATSNMGNPERHILHDFVEWRRELTTVEQVGAFRSVSRNVGSGDASGEAPGEPVVGADITASAFTVAPARPLMGRHLVPADERDGAPDVVVLGHDLWQSRFGGDPDIVGRAVRMGGEPHTVIGVMPELWRFPVRHGFWTPFRYDPTDYPRLEGPSIEVFGRLAPGVSMEQARAELATLGRRAAAAHPETHADLRATISPYTHEQAEISHPLIARMLRVVQVVVSLLLVVVCANVAILVYARTVTRRGEIAVRSALGASRRRILGHLFVEGLVLSALATGAGLAVAAFALSRAQMEVASTQFLPYWLDFRLSPGTALYAAALAVLAAFLVGVLPGWKATGRRLQPSLGEVSRGGGRPLGRTWSALIVGQVAVGVALIPPTCVLAWGMVRPSLGDPGMPVEEVVVASVAFPGTPVSGGPDADAEREAFRTRLAVRQAELVSRLEAEPGVRAVALSSGTPGPGSGRPIELEGGATLPPGRSAPWAGYSQVSPGFFRVYDGRVLAGRAFGAGDADEGSRAVLVNESFARQLAGGRGVVGRRLKYLPLVNVAYPAPTDVWFEIVGVVGDLPPGPHAPGTTTAGIYHPVGPGDLAGVTLNVRTAADPEPLVGRVRQIAAEVDPTFQLLGAGVLADAIAEGRSLMMIFVASVLAIALAVLLLSAAGMYALTSFTVARRTREIGIRAALGAGPRRMLAAVLGRVALQLGTGVAVGAVVAGALFAAGGFTTEDAAALLLTMATFAAVGLLAALGPARRGLEVQPTEALREL